MRPDRPVVTENTDREVTVEEIKSQVTNNYQSDVDNQTIDMTGKVGIVPAFIGRYGPSALTLVSGALEVVGGFLALGIPFIGPVAGWI